MKINIKDLSVGYAVLYKLLDRYNRTIITPDHLGELESALQNGLIKGIELNPEELRKLNFKQSKRRLLLDFWYHDKLEVVFNLKTNFIRIGQSYNFKEKYFVHEIQKLISALGGDNPNQKKS